MALINLPAKFGFTSVDFKLQRAGSMARSRYTGKTQRTVFPFAVWMLNATLVEYPEPEASAIRSFLVKLEGIKNTFQLPVPGYIRQGNYNGATLVAQDKAVRSTDLILDTGSAANIGALLFKEGDYFTIQDELKTVTADCYVDATGKAQVFFQPPLRKAVNFAANGNVAPPVNFKTPYCLMYADDDDVASWQIKPPVKHGVKFSAIEAV